MMILMWHEAPWLSPHLRKLGPAMEIGSRAISVRP